VDAQRRLLGVVTFDDAMDVMDAEAEEDLLRLAGTGPIERPMSAPVARRIRVRLPWLVVTLLGATAAVVVLSAFEATFEQKLALAMFTPVLAAMCGNIAMQSTAMLVRAFATGEVELRQTARIVGGELLVGTGLGALCGILGGILAAVLFGDVLLGAIVHDFHGPGHGRRDPRGHTHADRPDPAGHRSRRRVRSVRDDAERTSPASPPTRRRQPS
jgi:magnesium transporter